MVLLGEPSVPQSPIDINILEFAYLNVLHEVLSQFLKSLILPFAKIFVHVLFVFED